MTRTREEREKIFLESQGLVAKQVLVIARRTPSESLDDLYQIAKMGLWRATKTWDPDQSTLSTYAHYWVRAYLNRHVAKKSLVRLPAHRAKLRKEITHYCHVAERTTGERPTPEAICEKFGISEQLRCFLIGAGGHLSLVLEPVDDVESAETRYGDREMMEKVRAAVGTLPKARREVIENRYGLSGDSITQQVLADNRGVTRQRIHQIEQRALAQLRDLVAI